VVVLLRQERRSIRNASRRVRAPPCRRAADQFSTGRPGALEAWIVATARARRAAGRSAESRSERARPIVAGAAAGAGRPSRRRADRRGGHRLVSSGQGRQTGRPTSRTGSPGRSSFAFESARAPCRRRARSPRIPPSTTGPTAGRAPSRRPCRRSAPASRRSSLQDGRSVPSASIASAPRPKIGQVDRREAGWLRAQTRQPSFQVSKNSLRGPGDERCHRDRAGDGPTRYRHENPTLLCRAVSPDERELVDGGSLAR